jgi:hypothetical protein
MINIIFPYLQSTIFFFLIYLESQLTTYKVYLSSKMLRSKINFSLFKIYLNFNMDRVYIKTNLEEYFSIHYIIIRKIGLQVNCILFILYIHSFFFFHISCEMY